MTLTFFKGVVLGAVTSTLVLGAAAALAGTGVGDVFNREQTNTVDRSSKRAASLSCALAILLSPHFTGLAKWARRAHFL